MTESQNESWAALPVNEIQAGIIEVFKVHGSLACFQVCEIMNGHHEAGWSTISGRGGIGGLKRRGILVVTGSTLSPKDRTVDVYSLCKGEPVPLDTGTCDCVRNLSDEQLLAELERRTS